jgi:hypothetical protein
MRTKRKPLPPLAQQAAAAVLCGLLAGCAGPNNDGDILADLVESVMPPKPSDVAREAFNVYDADMRRRSVALLSSSYFGHEEPYVRTYRLLIDDQDPTVRAACAHALGIHGTTEDAPVLISLLKDETGFVRWEAAKALQKIHHPNAVMSLMDVLADDEDADVRMAAAQALGQYPSRPVFNALVGALSDPNFGVVHAASDSLAVLTGYKLGSDGGDWLDFAAENPSGLFRNGRQYTYKPYQKPPGRFDKIKFWENNDPPAPRVPVGLEPTDSGG